MFRNIFTNFGNGMKLLNKKEYAQIVQRRNKRIFKRTPISVIENDEMSKAATLREYKDKQFSRPGDKTAMIFNSEQLDDFDEDFAEDDSFDYDMKKKIKVVDKKENEETKLLLKNVEEILKEDSINKFEKTSSIPGQIKLQGFRSRTYKSEQNIVKMIKSSRLKNKLNTEEEVGLFVEGWRIIADFLVAKIEPKAIFFSRTNAIAKLNNILKMQEFDFIDYINKLPMYKTPYNIMNVWSAMKTPPGIMAVFDLSSTQKYVSQPRENSLPITVILDRIRDPQNLGGLLRTIAAAGVRKTILTEGCCNVWDIRSIRASSGGILKLHFEVGMSWSEIQKHIPENSSIFLAHACQDTDEGVPFKNTSNVPEDCDVQIIESNKCDSKSNFTVDKNGTNHDSSYIDPEILNFYKNVRIPTENYENVHYFGDADHLVLVIGSECGLGAESRKFAVEYNGIEINIPMMEGIDSLNNNAAGAIILFEITRQYRMSKKTVIKNIQ